MDFLKVTIRRNPKLIKASVKLHQEGIIPPNTIVIDLDTIKDNARIIKDAADKYKIKIYFMTKQFGRNPIVSKFLASLGMKAVAVDMEDVRCLKKANIPIGHVGHLSQIPKNEIRFVLEKVQPEVITVFTVEKAKQIAKVAHELGVVQKLLIRPVGKGDFFYPNQEGGIPEDNVIEAVKTINSLPNVKVVGVTSFPCFRFNFFTRKDEPTPNLYTILRVASRLEKEAGIQVEQINAPANNSAKQMEILANYGVTHAEPGHGFTGTTPWHAFEDLPEKPAWVYVTEVSHIFNDIAYVFGGNFSSADMCVGIWDYFYHHFMASALVGDDPDHVLENMVLARIVTGYFDYYIPLHIPKDIKIKVGDTAIFALRTQAFASRANIAIVSGIQSDKPKLEGIFDRCGNKLD
jgi:predicted amino acid racemase